MRGRFNIRKSKGPPEGAYLTESLLRISTSRVLEPDFMFVVQDIVR